MRKFLRILFFAQLPILIGILAVTALNDNLQGSSVFSKDQFPEQQQFLLNATNRTACLVNEKVNVGAIFLFFKTKDHSSPGWFANLETIEHLITVKSVEYIEAVVDIRRFRSTDIIFPFHSFL